MFRVFATTPETMGPGEIGAHSARAEAMGRAARARVEAAFSLTRTRHDYDALYQRLLARRGVEAAVPA